MILGVYVGIKAMQPKTVMVKQGVIVKKEAFGKYRQHDYIIAYRFYISDESDDVYRYTVDELIYERFRENDFIEYEYIKGNNRLLKVTVMP